MNKVDPTIRSYIPELSSSYHDDKGNGVITNVSEEEARLFHEKYLFEHIVQQDHLESMSNRLRSIPMVKECGFRIAGYAFRKTAMDFNGVERAQILYLAGWSLIIEATKFEKDTIEKNKLLYLAGSAFRDAAKVIDNSPKGKSKTLFLEGCAFGDAAMLSGSEREKIKLFSTAGHAFLDAARTFDGPAKEKAYLFSLAGRAFREASILENDPEEKVSLSYLQGSAFRDVAEIFEGSPKEKSYISYLAGSAFRDAAMLENYKTKRAKLFYLAGCEFMKAAKLENRNHEKSVLFYLAGWLLIESEVFESNLEKKANLYSDAEESFKDAITAFRNSGNSYRYMGDYILNYCSRLEIDAKQKVYLFSLAGWSFKTDAAFECDPEEKVKLLSKSGSAFMDAAQIEVDNEDRVKLFSLAGWSFVEASLLEVDLEERGDLFSKVKKAFRDAGSAFIDALDSIDVEERSKLFYLTGYTFRNIAAFDGVPEKQVTDAFRYAGSFFRDVLAAMRDDRLHTRGKSLPKYTLSGYSFRIEDAMPNSTISSKYLSLIENRGIVDRFSKLPRPLLYFVLLPYIDDIVSMRSVSKLGSIVARHGLEGILRSRGFLNLLNTSNFTSRIISIRLAQHILSNGIEGQQYDYETRFCAIKEEVMLEKGSDYINDCINFVLRCNYKWLQFKLLKVLSRNRRLSFAHIVTILNLVDRSKDYKWEKDILEHIFSSTNLTDDNIETILDVIQSQEDSFYRKKVFTSLIKNATERLSFAHIITILNLVYRSKDDKWKKDMLEHICSFANFSYDNIETMLNIIRSKKDSVYIETVFRSLVKNKNIKPSDNNIKTMLSIIQSFRTGLCKEMLVCLIRHTKPSDGNVKTMLNIIRSLKTNLRREVLVPFIKNRLVGDNFRSVLDIIISMKGEAYNTELFTCFVKNTRPAGDDLKSILNIILSRDFYNDGAFTYLIKNTRSVGGDLKSILNIARSLEDDFVQQRALSCLIENIRTDR